jgi:hypothetical protein
VSTFDCGYIYPDGARCTLSAEEHARMSHPQTRMVRAHDGRGVVTNAPDRAHGTVQVVLIDSLIGPFEQWLNARGLHLFQIPDTDPDDLPTYGVGIIGP